MNVKMKKSNPQTHGYLKLDIQTLSEILVLSRSFMLNILTEENRGSRRAGEFGVCKVCA